MEQPDSRINYQFLFHVLPDPIILIDRTGTIVDLNLSAKDTFATISVGDKTDKLFIDKKKTRDDIAELLKYHKVITDKAILRINDSEVQPYEFKLTILSESNEIFVLQFNHLNTKNELLRLEVEQNFASELHSLKPYLNKSGKELVEKKISTNRLNAVFETKTNIINPKQYVNTELKDKIKARFPQLSNNELSIAYFIGIGASINQIAGIRQKNANAIRVMVHRMLSKTNNKTTTEFSNQLQSIINV